MKKLLILPALLLMLACAQSRNQDTANTPADQSETENKTITVKGEVVQVTLGKDGYTAELKTSTGETYFATISRSNLNNPEQYKTVVVGDKMKVSGDSWKMDNENQVTVREIW